jgi:hypothetical protein
VEFGFIKKEEKLLHWFGHVKIMDRTVPRRLNLKFKGRSPMG